MIRRSPSSEDSAAVSSAQRNGRNDDGHLSSEAAVLWKEKDYQGCKKLIEEIASSCEDDVRISVESNFLAARSLARNLPATREDFAYLQEAAATAQAKHGLPDTILLLLNTATVLFHSRQYQAATKLLEPAWQSLQRTSHPRLSEGAAIALSFLLLDVYLACREHARAAEIVCWLEQRYDLPNEEREDSDGKSLSTPDHGQREDSVHSGDFSQQVSPSSLGSSELVTKSVSGYNVTQLVLSYKARLHILASDLKGAKRGIRNLLALDPRQNQAVSLKAELEALRGNLRRAGKLVITGAHEGQGISSAEEVQMLCNMGFVQHCEGRHHAAALCYSKALQRVELNTAPLLALEGEHIHPGPEHVQDTDVALLYNSGIQALLLKQYDTALHCFQGCMPVMYWDPNLWQRMAECCIEAALANLPLQHAADAEAASGQGASGEGGQESAARMSLRGTLQYGKQCATNANLLYSKEGASSRPPNGVQNSPALEGNAMDAVAGSSDVPEAPEVIAPLQQAIAAHEAAVHRAGRLAALCTLAFLCLQLDEPASALLHAQDILKDADPSSAEWQLGQNYISEALCQLGKAPKAAEHLQAALAESLNQPISPPKHEHVPNGGLASVEDIAEHEAVPASPGGNSHAARVLLLVNLASTFFSLNDFNQAQEFARTAAEDVESRDALLMHVYLELCRGDTGSAISQLKAFQLGVGMPPGH